ncbi:MAG: phage tail protein [Planctomycetota bacterium]
MRIARRGIWVASLTTFTVLATVLSARLTAPAAELMQGPGQAQAAPTHRFLVEIDGIPSTGFASVSGLQANLGVLAYRAGNATSTIKIPGMLEHSNLVLRASITQMSELWKWFKKVQSGSPDKRSMVITLLDQANQAVVRYKVLNAWPCAWRTPAMQAQVNEVAVEEVELAIEGFEREGGA